MNFDLTKMLKSVVKSSTKSLLSTGLKNQVKGLIKRGMQKSPQDIEKEIQATLGYMTSHYKLDKEQRIIFRPSSVFMHEWLSNSPLMKDKLVKDEENGQAYYHGQLLTNQRQGGNHSCLHQGNQCPILRSLFPLRQCGQALDCLFGGGCAIQGGLCRLDRGISECD